MASRPLRQVLRRPIDRFFATESGATVIEFAFGSVILVMLFAGIVDVSRAMFVLNSIEHAAKEGVRYAAIHGEDSPLPKTDTEIRTYVESHATGLDTNDYTVTVVWAPNKKPGSDVTIQMNYAFTFFFGDVFTSGPVTLSAQSTYTIGR